MNLLISRILRQDRDLKTYIWHEECWRNFVKGKDFKPLKETWGPNIKQYTLTLFHILNLKVDKMSSDI